ncbi:hypothetical protein CDD82_2138 [Ophiocordyceps australis]|uniref:Uncharacterized protein n=1 Tax=Ophiocordyceps australis TaxID=1399860 RepID=A0A2C5Y256_9HYPO|nr:hypothetical protein CDD82_2138 [Ophiocordyceps australis]
MTIGEDCMPTWPNRCWDEAVEKLHETIQHGLVHAQMVHSLGLFVRSAIINNGNRKLEEARRQGIKLDDVYIGRGLLPVWPMRTVKEDTGLTGGAALELQDYMADSSEKGPEEEGQFTHLSAQMEWADSSCSDSDGDWTCSEDEYDQVISMKNSICSEPIYEDIDDANIVHNVEVVGDSGMVDIQVLVVEDDEDIADMPEAELAVDYDGYEHHYGGGGDEAIDVEIQDGQLYCLVGCEEGKDQGQKKEENMEEQDVTMNYGQVFPGLTDDSSVDSGVDSDSGDTTSTTDNESVFSKKLESDCESIEE